MLVYRFLQSSGCVYTCLAFVIACSILLSFHHCFVLSLRQFVVYLYVRIFCVQKILWKTHPGNFVCFMMEFDLANQ